MLLSFAFIFLIGMVLGSVFEKMKLPKLLGMLLAGILIGPFVLNLIDESVLNISSELREIALIVILTRAGLNLDINDLKKVGRPAILMCFVPACFEIVAMIFFAPKLLGISTLDAAIMGTVVAAVSPAVIVPRMIKLIDEGCGTKKGVPQMIMAGASVDDVFVIILFTSFTGLAQSGEISASSFLAIPTSIIFGLIAGVIIGILIKIMFEKTKLSNVYKVIVMLSVSFVLLFIEDLFTGMIGFSGLLAIMAIGATLKFKNESLSKELSLSFNSLWGAAEILLFVLVGATVNIEYALKAGFVSVILIVFVTMVRMVGVMVCLLKTNLNRKERLFTSIAYTPKATVQAAIGGIPLAMGLSCGEIVLTVAVISIIVTAPIGALLIDNLYDKLLEK